MLLCILYAAVMSLLTTLAVTHCTVLYCTVLYCTVLTGNRRLHLCALGLACSPAALLRHVQGRHSLTWNVLLSFSLGTVNPGFGGQKFIEYQVEKVRKLRQMCDDAGVAPWIEVDGGISGKNAYKVCKACLTYSQALGQNSLICTSIVSTTAEHHFSRDQYMPACLLFMVSAW